MMRKKILKETKEALEQAARAGIEIVPATGRPIYFVVFRMKSTG